MDRPALNESQSSARQQLVFLARKMINGELSYLEGAPQVLELKDSIGGFPIEIWILMPLWLFHTNRVIFL